MHSTTFFASALSFAAVSLAAPAPQHPQPAANTINLNFNKAYGMDPNPNWVGYTIQPNTLTAFDISASSIAIDSITSSTIDVHTIECRIYNTDGTQAMSDPFTHAQKAGLSTNLAYVESILCYIVEPSELAKRDDAVYHGISLHINTNTIGEPRTAEPAPVELDVLTVLTGVSASELSFDTTVAINVDISKVECRAFKDAEGLVPGSAPFNYKHAAELSTNLVELGSVLCYVVTQDEAAAF